jgi:hypothetical protein
MPCRHGRKRLPPRRAAVAVGTTTPGWGPAVEAADPRTCPTCGGDLGPIAPGSEDFCLACLHSGRDGPLAAALAREVAFRRWASEQARAECRARLRERLRKRAEKRARGKLAS